MDIRVNPQGGGGVPPTAGFRLLGKVTSSLNPLQGNNQGTKKPLSLPSLLLARPALKGRE